MRIRLINEFSTPKICCGLTWELSCFSKIRKYDNTCAGSLSGAPNRTQSTIRRQNPCSKISEYHTHFVHSNWHLDVSYSLVYGSRGRGASPVSPVGKCWLWGFLGLPNPFPGFFLCGFGVFRVRATVGSWLSRYACPRCPPFPPMVPCTRRARRARRVHLFFWLSGCPWGRLLVGRVLRVLQGFLLEIGSGNTEGGWLPRDLRAIGAPCRER